MKIDRCDKCGRSIIIAQADGATIKLDHFAPVYAVYDSGVDRTTQAFMVREGYHALHSAICLNRPDRYQKNGEKE